MRVDNTSCKGVLSLPGFGHMRFSVMSSAEQDSIKYLFFISTRAIFRFFFRNCILAEEFYQNIYVRSQLSQPPPFFRKTRRQRFLLRNSEALPQPLTMENMRLTFKVISLTDQYRPLANVQLFHSRRFDRCSLPYVSA